MLVRAAREWEEEFLARPGSEGGILCGVSWEAMACEHASCGGGRHLLPKTAELVAQATEDMYVVEEQVRRVPKCKAVPSWPPRRWYGNS